MAGKLILLEEILQDELTTLSVVKCSVSLKQGSNFMLTEMGAGH